MEFECEKTKGGHKVVKLCRNGDWTTQDTVYYMSKEDEVTTFKKIKKIHEVTNHKSENQLIFAFRNANKLDDKVRKTIHRVVEGCKVCQKYKRSQGRPKVTLPKVTDFNQIVAIDLKQFGDKNVLWIVCSFTRYIQGEVIPNKEAKTIIDALNTGWNWRLGFPSGGFWADNGLEFKNKEMSEYASKFGFSVKFGPNYSP